MNMKRLVVLILLSAAVCSLFPVALAAQTASGPSLGTPAPELKIFALTGANAGQEIDVLATRANQSTAVLFIQADKWDRPIARFLRTLDQELSKTRPDVAIFAVWLTGDLDKTKEYLPRVQGSLSLDQTTLAVYPGASTGPPAWSISDGAHLTVIFIDQAKVTFSTGFRSVNELDVPLVVAKLPPKK